MFETFEFQTDSIVPFRGTNPSDHNFPLNRMEMVENEDQRIRHLDLKNELGFSMVSIRESTDFAKNDLAIFPPTNHENLYIDGFNRDRESPSESSSPSSSSRLSDSSLSSFDSDGQFEFDRKSHLQPSKTVGKSPPSPSHLPPSANSQWKSLIEIDVDQGWWKLLLTRVVSNLQKLVACFSSSSLCSLSRTLRSFYPILGIVIWWWKRNRVRRRLREGEIAAHLRNTIRERDERISQLLHQIAQMNELLVKKLHSN